MVPREAEAGVGDGPPDSSSGAWERSVNQSSAKESQEVPQHAAELGGSGMFIGRAQGGGTVSQDGP